MKRTVIIGHEYYNAEGGKAFYKGTSFRVHKGAPDTYYFNDDQYIDWVVYNGALCICARTHVSSDDNAPVLVYKQGVPVGIESNPCWDFALGGLAVEEGSPIADATRLTIDDGILYISNDEGRTGDYVGEVNTGSTGGDTIQPNPIDISAEVVSVQESDTTSSASVVVGENNKLQFSFTLKKGTDGKDGVDGANGHDGANGTDGKDGNGFDYIFCLTETPNFDKLDPSTLNSVQDDLFVPEGGTTYAQQVNETNEYQGVSTRKKTNGVGGTYSKPVILNSYATEGIVPEVSFTSFVFCRTNSTGTDNDNLPTGGSYESPYPKYHGTIGGNEVKWTDSIPAGTHQVWMTSRVFSTQNTSTEWAEPRVLTDTANFQVEYSRELTPTNPKHLQSYYDADPINYEDNGRIDNSTGSDEGTDAIGMATATMHNGVGSDGTVNKIKGEDGNDGTPINVLGEVATFEELPDCSTYNGNHGDAYIVTSYEGQSKVMFVYTGDDENCGLNIGPLAVQGAFLHIKYAKTLYDGTDTGNDWSNNNGETPDDYIGIYCDSVDDDSMDPSKYTWKKWTGEDGWGYEYIYQANNTGVAPHVPEESVQNNGDVPTGGSDDPINISEDMQYCWMCYRRKENNIGTRGYGAQSDDNYAALGSKGGQDGPEGPQGPAGQDGAGVEYIFAISSVNSTNFSEANIDDPNNSWAYDDPKDPGTDDPIGVSIEHPVEGVCERVKPQGATGGSDWSKPAVFSHYGKDGTDGPGVEYVFILDATDPYDNGNVVVPDHINQITTLSANQDIDYEPEYDGYKWQDDVQQVTKLLPYCGCSIRRIKNGSGGQFETPILGNQYIEGTTRVLVKIWKRTDVELTFDKRNAPSNASYNVSTGIVTLDSGTSNGGSSSEVLTGGKYLYSLGAHVVYNNSTEEIIINQEDGTVLTLESVNGTDGTGQSAVTMTVDPDSILVNVDNNNKARISLNAPCTANYYYGTSLLESVFSYTVPQGIDITPGESATDYEHSFQINIQAGFELKNSIPVTITLSPTEKAVENLDYSVTTLNPLSKNIYLNPIKSNDTWSIDLSTDQIVDHDDLDITVTANIIKNDTIYTGDDAKLTYLGGSETEENFPEDGLRITHDMVDDVGNEIIVILKVNDQSILHQSISILRNGSSGNDGVGIENIGEYYLGSSDGNDANGFDDKYFVGSDVNIPGKDVTIDNTTGTANKPAQFNPTKPYLGNIELLQYTNGEFKTTDPALISKSGKGIESITEGYLVSEQKSGVTFDYENGEPPSDSGWNKTYDQTQLTENEVVGNVEVIKYDDGTYSHTTPVIIGMYSKGDKGDNADPVYSITLNRYSESPLYVEAADGSIIGGLDTDYEFEYTFRKDNNIIPFSAYYVTIYSEKGVTLNGLGSTKFRLRLGGTTTDEFIVKLQFRTQSSPNTLLLEVPITFYPQKAVLDVVTYPDTIDLGYRKAKYSNTDPDLTQYPAHSDDTTLKAYLNGEEIRNDIINIEIATTDLKGVTVVKDMIGYIHLDYSLYYKENLEENSDIMSRVDAGELNTITLMVQYRETNLKIPVDLTLTTNQLNPDYLKIYATPNVILPTDTDNQVRVRISSVEDTYVTNIELDTGSYRLQYNIDDGDGVTVTSDHAFSMGYFLGPKKDILKNIKFRITDKSDEPIVYTQEIIERVGLNTDEDYFNGLPNVLLCPGVYELDAGYYEFSPNIVSYDTDNGQFFINKFTQPFITITRYTSDDVDNRQILAQKTFGIKYSNKVSTESNLITSDNLPYTIKSCGGYIELGPKCVSIFNLIPGFTTIKNSVGKYPNYQIDIPYYGSDDENSFGNDISEDILNDLYGLIGKSYAIKFDLVITSINTEQNIFGNSASLNNNDVSFQCNGETFRVQPGIQGLLIKIDYNSIIKDDGTVAVMPSITYKSSKTSTQ